MIITENWASYGKNRLPPLLKAGDFFR